MTHIKGVGRGGTVCATCYHNTIGENCEFCKNGFYPDSSKIMTGESDCDVVVYLLYILQLSIGVNRVNVISKAVMIFVALKMESVLVKKDGEEKSK